MILGAALGELTLAKRDKVTFICSPSLGAFPSWVEQLIAESTGKENKGIVPVANESLAPPEKYGDDRFFVYLRLESDSNHDLDRQVAALEANGHPVARIDLDDKYDIGQEFFRWEFAVAAAGAALGINPFNQPDVQLAKDLSKKAMSESGSARREVERRGRCRRPRRSRKSGRARGSARKSRATTSWCRLTSRRRRKIARSCERSAPRCKADWAWQRLWVLARASSIPPVSSIKADPIRRWCYRSSTNLPIILAVPETNYTFDALIQAQAIGDFTALKQRRRRALRVNLGGDRAGGLDALDRGDAKIVSFSREGETYDGTGHDRA